MASTKIPKQLLAHYEQLMAGRKYERNGIATLEGGRASFASRDLETMDRLLQPEMVTAWEEIEASIGTAWLPRLFDALWVANLNWNGIRSIGGKSRKSLIASKLKQIMGAIGKLEIILDEFHELASPAGGGPGRNPDAWPDNPFLRLELAALAERCGKFNAENMSCEQFINTAFAAREAGRAYLRALVAKLDEMGFPFGENRTPTNVLINLADAAANADGTIDYDAFYSVLQPVRKKRSG